MQHLRIGGVPDSRLIVAGQTTRRILMLGAYPRRRTAAPSPTPTGTQEPADLGGVALAPQKALHPTRAGRRAALTGPSGSPDQPVSGETWR